ncbi:MAG: RluA family pseudouridine synthase [Kiritimatiellia bacterium]
MNTRRAFTVEGEDAGTRLDIWLARRMEGLSRSRIQKLIREGLITLNRRPAKESRKIRPGETAEVSLPPPRQVELKAEEIPLDIIHEDDSVIIVNKPAGMVVHPAAGHDSGTLVNALLYRCPKLEGIGGEMRPGIVHRLDKDTSGVIVVAKTDRAMLSLAGQFRRREIKKEYLAVVRGALAPGAGEIRTLIGRHASDRKKMSATAPRGRLSVTRYETVKTAGDYSLVKVFPETGRTHQIRVHLAHAQHPVVGDRQYGKRAPGAAHPAAGRQMLHACKITLRHPGTGELAAFFAPLPEDMRLLIERLQLNS